MPPPTDEASISSPSASAITRTGRPRRPYAQNIRETSRFADSDGAGSSPPPRSATKARPDLISTTQPVTTSPIRAWRSESKRAAATETQAASNPAIAGRVPSIGSTTRTQLARSCGATSPRSSE